MARGIVAVAVLLAALTPAAGAGGPFAGACVITVRAEWTPALGLGDTVSTMQWTAGGSQCVGSALLAGAFASATSDQPRPMSCANAMSSGSGTLEYDGARSTAFQWQFAGTIGAGTLVLMPNASTIAGVVQVLQSSALAACAQGLAQSAVTWVGTLSWFEMA
jgi:hypothetical protein